MNESDDEDLFAPQFLQNHIKAINEKSKISLASLLNEKNKESSIKKASEDILHLENQFREADLLNLEQEIEDDANNLEASQMSQDLDYSQDVPEENVFQDFDDKQDSNLKQLTSQFQNDFPDTFPGVKIFVYPVESFELKSYVNVIVEFVMGPEELEDAEIEEMDNPDFLYDILNACVPVNGKFSSEVCKCFWKVTYGCSDYKTSQSALRVLTNYLYNNNDPVIWLPSFQDFIDVLLFFGADVNVLIPETSPPHLLTYRTVKKNNQENIFVHSNTTRKSFNTNLHNFTSFVKLLTIYIQTFPLRYGIDELNSMLLLSFLFTVEKVLQVALWDIKVLIGALLDAYSATQWKEEMHAICTSVPSMDIHHRNLLQIVEAIPPTDRGVHFQQQLAYLLVNLILKKTMMEAAEIILPRHVMSLLQYIRIDENTDYFELFSACSMLPSVLCVDDVASSEKINLSNIASKLGSLHASIKECQGRYLDRTKVKGVLLRLVSKYTFAAQNIQTQSHLDTYFEKADSDIKIENLKQSLESEDEGDSDDSSNDNSILPKKSI